MAVVIKGVTKISNVIMAGFRKFITDEFEANIVDEFGNELSSE